MTLLNWQKEKDGANYSMEHISSNDDKYLVKFTADDTQLTVELTNNEIDLCRCKPDESFYYLHQMSIGFTPYLVVVEHFPEYEDVKLAEKRLMYDLNSWCGSHHWWQWCEGEDYCTRGCVIDRKSLRIQKRLWVKNTSEINKWFNEHKAEFLKRAIEKENR